MHRNIAQALLRVGIRTGYIEPYMPGSDGIGGNLRVQYLACAASKVDGKNFPTADSTFRRYSDGEMA